MSHQRELLRKNRFKVIWTWAGHFWPNLIGAVLAAYGITTLLWVFQLTLHDITTWSKDITLIFFSSRTAEPEFPTLGIDLRVIHYFLIGVSLLLLGLVVLFRRWNKLSPKVTDCTVSQLQKPKIRNEKARAVFAEEPFLVLEKLMNEEANLLEEKENLHAHLASLKNEQPFKVQKEIHKKKKEIQKLRAEIEDLKFYCEELSKSLRQAHKAGAKMKWFK